MSVEHNKTVARVWFERVMNGRDPEAIDDAYAPRYVHRGPDGHELRGIDAAKDVARHLIATVPDRVATVEAQVAEGDMVATRWSSAGTTADGVAVSAAGIVISRIEDGRIVEDYEITDIRT